MANINDEKSYHAHVVRKKVVRYIVLILLAIICLFPLYVMLINSSHKHEEIAKGLLVLPGSWFGM